MSKFVTALFLIAFMAGVRFPAPTVGFVVPNSPAARATPGSEGDVVGLQPGDTVTAIDGDETKTFIDLRVAAAMAKPGQELTVEVERSGKRISYRMTPERDQRSGLLSIGVDPARSSAEPAFQLGFRQQVQGVRRFAEEH